MPQSKDGPKAKSQSQKQRFIEAAKEAGCSDDETAFDEALKKIGKAKPEPKPYKEKS